MSDEKPKIRIPEVESPKPSTPRKPIADGRTALNSDFGDHIVKGNTPITDKTDINNPPSGE